MSLPLADSPDSKLSEQRWFTATPEPPLENAAGPLEARLAKWAELTEAKRGLEAELRKVQESLTKMEPALLESMADAGVKSVNINGWLVYHQREFHCNLKEGVEKEQMIEAFRAAGLTHALGMQWQTMRAISKEWAEAGEEPPQAIANLIDVGETFRLRTRKA